jgi:hypothetical protein
VKGRILGQGQDRLSQVLLLVSVQRRRMVLEAVDQAVSVGPADDARKGPGAIG